MGEGVLRRRVLTGRIKSVGVCVKRGCVRLSASSALSSSSL